MNVILTIAGSDSSAGAGLQADIKSSGANGGYATTAVTAITAQNTTGVQAIELLSPRLIRAQIDSVFDDLPVHAVKTGMLGNREISDRTRLPKATVSRLTYTLTLLGYLSRVIDTASA